METETETAPVAKPARNHLPDRNKYRLTQWVDQNRDTVLKHSDAETAEAAQLELGFTITRANIAGVLDALEIARPPKVSATPLSPEDLNLKIMACGRTLKALAVASGWPAIADSITKELGLGTEPL